MEKTQHRRAVVIFLNEGDEHTDFKSETGCFDLCDVLNKYPHQFLHFDQKARFSREMEALVELLPQGLTIQDKVVKSRFNNEVI